MLVRDMLVVEIQKHVRRTLPDKRIRKLQHRQVIERQSQWRIGSGSFASISVNSVDVRFVVHLLCHVASSSDEGFDLHPPNLCKKPIKPYE